MRWHKNSEQGESDFFGPGTDLAISILAIFLLYAVVNEQNLDEQVTRLKQEITQYRVKDSILTRKMEPALQNEYSLAQIKQKQLDLIDSIAVIYGIEKKGLATLDKDAAVAKYSVFTGLEGESAIAFENFATIQRITFGESLLFPSGSAVLIQNGHDIISNVGRVISENAEYLSEIQIQGHADTVIPRYFNGSNLELASARATSVFYFLRDSIGVNPAKILVSIVSFGEYKPVARNNDDRNWNWNRILEENALEEQRSRNRRIEIVLHYRKL